MKLLSHNARCMAVAAPGREAWTGVTQWLGCSFPPRLIWNMTHITGIRGWIKEHLFKMGLGTLLKKPKYHLESSREPWLLFWPSALGSLLWGENQPLPDDSQLINEASTVQGVCLKPACLWCLGFWRLWNTASPALNYSQGSINEKSIGHINNVEFGICV